MKVSQTRNIGHTFLEANDDFLGIPGGEKEFAFCHQMLKQQARCEKPEDVLQSMRGGLKR